MVTDKPLVHAAAECGQSHCTDCTMASQILHECEPKDSTST